MPVPVSFPTVDPFFPETTQGRDRHLRQLSGVVQGIMGGKINAAFDFDLEPAPAVTTTVSDARIADTSRIQLVPINAAADTHLASGTVRITEVTRGSFTLTHVPSPVTRSFRMSFLS